MSDALLLTRLALARVRRSAALTTFMVAAIAAATVMVLIVASAENAVEARGARQAQRRPPAPSAESSASRTLVAFTETLVAGRGVAVIELAAIGPSAPAPAGLDSLPPPGTVVVSPALAETIDALPDIGLALGEIAGNHIAPAGLVEPGELVAFRAWEPDVLARIADVSEVHRFPLPAASAAWWKSKAAVRLGMLLLAVGLVVPALLLIGVLARLALAQRRRFLAGLRLIGATATQAAAIVAVEAGVAGLVGAVTGTLLFLAIRPLIARVSVGGAAWFPSDITPSGWALAGVIVAVPVLAAMSALLAARQALLSPLPVFSRAAASRLRPRTALAAVGLSVAWLAATALLGKPGSPIFLAVAIAGVCALMGTLPLVGPMSLAAVGRTVARFTRSPTFLLASRTASWDANAAFRPSLGLMVVVMFTTMVNGYATGNIVEVSPDWYNGHADISVDTATGDPVAVSAFLQAVASRAPTAVVLPIRQAVDVATGLSVAVAACDSVNELGIARVDDCSASDVFLAPSLHETPSELHVAGVVLTVTPATTGSLREDSDMCCLGADVLISPDALPVSSVSALPAHRILIRATEDASMEPVRGAALQHLPGARVTTLAELTASSSEPVHEARRIVNGAAALAMFIAATSLTAAAVGRHFDRASTYIRLRAAGTPVITIARSIYVETCSSLLIAIVLGTAAGLVVSKALVATLDGRFTPSAAALALVPLGACLLAALATTVMMVPLARGTRPELLRPT